MPTILEQLRAAQREAGLTAPTHPEEEVIILGTELARLNPEYLALPKPPAAVERVHIGPTPPHGNLTVSVGCSRGGGYIKIFPPTFHSLAELTPEWVAANWGSPSPWCRIEGLPDHPEFEANLAGVER